MPGPEPIRMLFKFRNLYGIMDHPLDCFERYHYVLCIAQEWMMSFGEVNEDGHITNLLNIIFGSERYSTPLLLMLG